jgi:hypothetical protein
MGRSWSTHLIEDECPCPKAPCGLVVQDTALDTCPEHATQEARTMRQGHPSEHCPGTDLIPQNYDDHLPKETPMTTLEPQEDLEIPEEEWCLRCLEGPENKIVQNWGTSREFQGLSVIEPFCKDCHLNFWKCIVAERVLGELLDTWRDAGKVNEQQFVDGAERVVAEMDRITEAWTQFVAEEDSP